MDIYEVIKELYADHDKVFTDGEGRVIFYAKTFIDHIYDIEYEDCILEKYVNEKTVSITKLLSFDSRTIYSNYRLKVNYVGLDEAMEHMKKGGKCKFHGFNETIDDRLYNYNNNIETIMTEGASCSLNVKYLDKKWILLKE